MHNTCRDWIDETKAQPQTRGGALQAHQYLDRESAPTYKNDGGLICFSNLQKGGWSELGFTLPKALPGQAFTQMNYWNGPRSTQGRHRGFYSDYFTVLNHKLDKHKILSENIYNMDKEGFMLGNL
jgi:hypothetical protein